MNFAEHFVGILGDLKAFKIILYSLCTYFLMFGLFPAYASFIRHSIIIAMNTFPTLC